MTLPDPVFRPNADEVGQRPPKVTSQEVANWLATPQKKTSWLKNILGWSVVLLPTIGVVAVLFAVYWPAVSYLQRKAVQISVEDAESILKHLQEDEQVTAKHKQLIANLQAERKAKHGLLKMNLERRLEGEVRWYTRVLTDQVPQLPEMEPLPNDQKEKFKTHIATAQSLLERSRSGEDIVDAMINFFGPSKIEAEFINDTTGPLSDNTSAIEATAETGHNDPDGGLSPFERELKMQTQEIEARERARKMEKSTGTYLPSQKFNRGHAGINLEAGGHTEWEKRLRFSNTPEAPKNSR